MKGFILAIILLGIESVPSALAQNIDQSRGADADVDYSSLTEYGPWDDRNYALTKSDLAWLADNEAELTDPIPAFFRVELRREFPHFRREGPAQYPRAAVPVFNIRYGGLIWDGEYIDGGKVIDEGESGDELEGLVNGEIKLNQVLGANEVTVEINPANSLQVIAGSNNNGGQEMYYSTDGGENWFIHGVLPSTCCDPTVDWKSDGTIAYVAALTANPMFGVSFWRSFNGGQTWVDRFDITPSGSDKEFIHVDRSPASPHQDNIYLTYHNGNVMQFARSTDDGASWDIQDFPGAPVGIGSDITTTNSGDIYYVYGAFGTRTIELLKSTDGGVTFAPSFTITPTTASYDWPIPAMDSRYAWIYAATDSDRSGGPFDGSVYVAFTDTTAPDNNNDPSVNHAIVEVWYSRNGGATWDSSNPHSMADTETVDRFNQWIKVDELGNVHVVFYDTRHSDNRTGVDFYYNVSTDGGVTWGEPQRVTSQTSQKLTDNQEWGDYNGISVLFDQTLSTWTDNRDGPPNSKDVYVADMDNQVAEATFFLAGDNLDQWVCKPDDLIDINLEVSVILGFSDPVTLSTVGAPAGFSTDFTPSPVNPPGVSLVETSVSGAAPLGAQSYDILGSDGIVNRTVPVNVDVFDSPPGTTTLSQPPDEALDVSATPTLEWAALPQGGNYTVEIDDDPAFGSVDHISVTGANTLIVETPLNNSETYYWRVSATNACAAGAYSEVFSFTVETAPGDCGPGADAVLYFADDMEGGTNGWTHMAQDPPDTWALDNSDSNSPTMSWSADDVASVSDQLLVSPPIAVPGGVSSPTLQFYTRFDLEEDGANCYDGGILEYSTDGGASWAQVANDRLLTLPYTGTVNSCCDNPLQGLQAWCNTQDWTRAVVDLGGWQGQTLNFRFRLGTDFTMAAGPWHIDDFAIQSCELESPNLEYKDGFENL